MKVLLSGYNLDVNLIGKKKTQKSTPETISAAYARISRSKKSVDKLREEAIQDVEKAKLSNNSIVFEMGHSSVAEHTVFNFDLIGISRYLTEFIQRSRLASFTEKSQRYVTLAGDFYLPQELKNSPLEEKFVSTIEKQNELYFALYEKAKQKLEAENFAGSKRELYGKAKEDARYFLSLSTQTQMGMTINARSLQKLLVRLDKLDLWEAKELREKLKEEAKKIAPSLIRYTSADDFGKHSLQIALPKQTSSEKQVRLLRCSENPDDLVLQGLLLDEGFSYHQSNEYLAQASISEKEKIFTSLFAKAKFYSAMPRGFELADFTFEICCSACCFGQLKRHRMSTMLKSGYHPEKGFVTPELINSLQMEDKISKVMQQTNELYLELESYKKGLGNYILTNAHKTTVLFKANLREIYHFSRLRGDRHAQWEIQEIAKKIDVLVKEKAPLAGKILGGKDEIFA